MPRTGRPRSRATDTTASRYKAADGRWHAKVTMGLRPDGTVDRRHVSRKTKTELEKAVRALERSRDTGAFVWTADDPTVADWIAHWLENILPMSARRKTLATYRSQMRRHVLPVLGREQLSELTTEQLEKLYRDLVAAGHSGHTVRAVHRVLRAALNEAVRRRRLHANPAQWARPPRAEVPETDPLTIEESRRILAAASSRANPPRWSIALSLGLRQGEALGLLWQDLDLERSTLQVRRSVQRWTWLHGCTDAGQRDPCGRKRGAECPHRRDGGIRLVEPKTKASRRTIVLPPQLVEELRTHRAAQLRARLEWGALWDDTHDLVFASVTGSLIDPAQDHREWKALLAAAGVRPMRLHDARHTAATLLLLQGVDVRTVMAVMGWTEMATAQRYTHAVDELRVRAATRMGELFWPSQPPGLERRTPQLTTRLATPGGGSAAPTRRSR